MCKTTSALIGCLLMLLGTGCMHTRFQNHTRTPISFTHNLGVTRDYEVVRRVDEDYRRIWLLFYMLPVGKDGSDMVTQSAIGSDGMANLRIKSQFDVVDILITNLTFGLVCTRAVNIQGDLVRFKPEPVAVHRPPSVAPVSATTTLPATPRSTATINCLGCGKQNAPNAAFCAGCGKEIKVQDPIHCWKCGEVAQPDTRFCTKCGTDLHKVAVSPASDQP